MLVSAIAAMAHRNVIGHNNQIPWYLPADLSYFKRTTLNHHVLMGRNSFEGIGHPLPNRTNIVISRNTFFTADGVLVAHSIEDALGIAYDHGETEAFIIGGGVIFQDAFDLFDKIYITEVDLEVEGDAFFPEINPAEWREIWREAHEPDAKNEHKYVFRVLERIEEEASEG